MDAVEGNDSATERIVLAHEPPFRLGSLGVEPAMRRIAHQDGREEILEQRVMQVLVALVRANGAILSRDDLIATCWDGRIVGDDAINRVMSRLRRTADGLGAGIFRIETITKVGYRLVRQGAGDRIPDTIRSGPAAIGHPMSLRGWIAAGIIAVLLVLGGILLWASRSAEPAPATVAVLAEGAGAEGRGLARDLAADLSRLAAARPTQLVVVDAAHAAQADYVVRIGSERRAGRLHARLTLSSRAAGELLWSARFDRLVEERAELRQQAAVKLGDVLLCATEAIMAEGHRMDAVTRRLYLSACDRNHEAISPRMLALLRQITERSPNFARGWGMRAMIEAFEGMLWLEDTPRKRAFREAASRHIARARALDPTLGEIFFAEALLAMEPDRRAEQLAIYERGIAVAPDYAPLHYYRDLALRQVGRAREGMESTRRAVALDPLAPENRGALVTDLAQGGRFAEARRELAEAERLWPRSGSLRVARFRLELRQGDPRQALRMLDDPANSDIFDSSRSGSDLRLFLHARIDRTPAAIDAVVSDYTARQHREPDSIFSFLQALGEFGRVDEAYRVIERPGAIDPLRWRTEILFSPQMRPIRNDPRFMPLALRLGLLHYWRASGHWPDFCDDPDLPYDCRAEARRLLAARR